jgi:YVTN family beta-propeller protein
MNSWLDGSEVGIDGVLVELYLDNGNGEFEPAVDTLVAQALTADNPGTPNVESGWYEFQISDTDGFYWVVVGPSNFLAGGPLAGFAHTSVDTFGPNLMLVYLPSGIQTYKDADFGYARTAIQIVKRAGAAADGETLSIPAAGASVTYSYTVTNAGDVPVAWVTVTDDAGTPLNTADDVTVCTIPGPLARGVSAACSWTTFVDGDRRNIAVASGVALDPNGESYPEPVIDTDDAVVVADGAATATPTATSTATRAATETPTATPTPTGTETQTRTPTTTQTPTVTGTTSTANTPTATWTPSPTASPTAVPTCGPDEYETDDSPGEARNLVIGSPAERHNLHAPGDADWYSLSLQAGRSYRVRTFDLSPPGDVATTISLYDSGGASALATFAGDPAAGASFRVAVTGTYLIQVQESQGRGDCRAYSIVSEVLTVYIPIIVVPAPTPTPTPTMSPTPTPTPRPTSWPGLAHPKAAVVHPNTHRVYVTSRDNDRVVMLDGDSLAEVMHADVGSQPWGVDLDVAANKLYVANFASGDVTVLDATTLEQLKVIRVGGQPTFVDVNPITGKVFVVVYGSNLVAIIDVDEDRLEASVPTGGGGAWGLAVNPNLNQVYVSNRDSGTVTTLDGDAGYRVVQALPACGGSRPSPYSLAFNEVTNRLYLACSRNDNVDTARVFSANPGGLTLLASIQIGNGGSDGGGGVAVNTTTGHAFFSNSVDNTVSVIDSDNKVSVTWATGLSPFGIGVDPVTSRFYVVNRASNDVTMIADN